VLAGGEVDRAQVRVLGRVAIDHLETARTRRVPIEQGCRVGMFNAANKVATPSRSQS